MNLTLWECKKVLQRRAAKISLCLALMYALFMGVWNGINNLAYKDGNNSVVNTGMKEIEYQYTCAEKWKGPLTGELLVAVKEQYNKAYLPQNVMTYEDESIGPSNQAYDTYIRPLGSIPEILHRTFCYIPEYSSYDSLKIIPDGMLRDYYTQRDTIVSDYLKSQISDEKDREFFINQNEQVKVPFDYDWEDGQAHYLRFIGSVVVFATLFLCIALAPLFANEYQQDTISLLLCAKHGRSKLVKAKINAAMVITTGCYLLSMMIYFICQLFFVGTRGLACPIQLIKPIATAPITIGQAELYAFVLGFLGCLAMVAFTIALSSKLSSSFPVIILSLLLLLLPPMIGSVLPIQLQKLAVLLPVASDYSELFRINMYHLFGYGIWSPNLIMIAPIIIVLMCIPITVHCYQRHQVE